MTAKPDRNSWTPELGPGEMTALAEVLRALNAAEHDIAHGGIGLSLAGVLEVSIDAYAGSGTGYTHVGIIQPVDAAAWVFTPGDAEERKDWGEWAFMRWPEETIIDVIEAARAVQTAPLADTEAREALDAALDALDRSTYVLCAKRQHVLRSDHLGKDGEVCDHKPEHDD